MRILGNTLAIMSCLGNRSSGSSRPIEGSLVGPSMSATRPTCRCWPPLVQHLYLPLCECLCVGGRTNLLCVHPTGVIVSGVYLRARILHPLHGLYRLHRLCCLYLWDLRELYLWLLQSPHGERGR